MGLSLLGGLAVILAIWFMVQAAEGLSFAFPRRPSVVDPTKAKAGAQSLLILIAAGVLASLVVGFAVGDRTVISPYHLVIAAIAYLPIRELLTADTYRGAFIIVNAVEDSVRPALIAAISQVFGSVIEEQDRLVAADWEGDDFRLLIDEKSHVIVVDPMFAVTPAKAGLFVRALHDKLQGVKAPRFNERSFWFAFALPLALTILCAAVAFMLLNPATNPIDLRPTIGR